MFRLFGMFFPKVTFLPLSILQYKKTFRWDADAQENIFYELFRHFTSHNVFISFRIQSFSISNQFFF